MTDNGFTLSRADILSSWGDDDDGSRIIGEDDDMDIAPRFRNVTPTDIRIKADHLPRNAWMDTYGHLYHVDDYDHANVAHDVLGDDLWGDGLEDKGWLHISTGLNLYVTCRRPNMTNAQMDTLWDMYSARPDVLIGWQNAAVAQLRRLLNITVVD